MFLYQLHFLPAPACFSPAALELRYQLGPFLYQLEQIYYQVYALPLQTAFLPCGCLFHQLKPLLHQLLFYMRGQIAHQLDFYKLGHVLVTSWISSQLEHFSVVRQPAGFLTSSSDLLTSYILYKPTAFLAAGFAHQLQQVFTCLLLY